MDEFYHIITFGCQMNEHDSEKFGGQLELLGYQAADNPESADIILVNTCCIRDKAEQKAFSFLGRLRALKEKKKNLIIGVCGCLAQSSGAALLKRAPYIDMVIGAKSIGCLPQIINKVKIEKKAQLELGGYEYHNNRIVRGDPFRAWVTIMEGCDNYCTYCVVPYVRGREQSRPMGDIIDEIHCLSDKGCREVTLLGQNVNSYGNNLNNGAGFPYLLEKISEIQGISRIRFVTSHPKDLSLELIHKMAALPKVCNHLHLPLQSGSDRILSAMNRKYTLAAYWEKVRFLRELIPQISITSDIIVGFPGETDDDFKETLRALELIKFDSIFSFIYSDRPHTAASVLTDKVPRAKALRRFQSLIKLQEKINADRAGQMLGSSRQILVESISKTDSAKLSGRTGNNKLVHFTGSADLIGKLVDVNIIRACKNSFMGELV